MTIGFLLQSTRVLEGGIYDEEDLRMIYGYVIHIDDEILNDYYNTCTIFTYDNDLELYIEIIDALISPYDVWKSKSLSFKPLRSISPKLVFILTAILSGTSK